MIRYGKIGETTELAPRREGKTTEPAPERETILPKDFSAKRELGDTGLTAFMAADKVLGFPVTQDDKGNYIVTPQETNTPVAELKPGDIGYSARSLENTGPQVLGNTQQERDL